MINPVANTKTEQGAVSAARTGCIALWLSAAKYVVAGIGLASNFEAVKTQAAAETAAMGQADAGAVAAGIAVATPFVIAAVEAAAGYWQWRRPGVVLPIIWSLLVLFGIYQALTEGAPLWATAVLILFLLLHAAAIRGGLALERIRKAATLSAS